MVPGADTEGRLEPPGYMGWRTARERNERTIGAGDAAGREKAGTLQMKGWKEFLPDV